MFKGMHHLHTFLLDEIRTQKVKSVPQLVLFRACVSGCIACAVPQQ